MPRRSPEFEPGAASVEATQLESVGRCKRVSDSAAGDADRNRFLRLFVYIHSVKEKMLTEYVCIELTFLELLSNTASNQIRHKADRMRAHYWGQHELPTS